VPPKRDAFTLALSALRDRLRQGVDAPGDALPIKLIAEDLRLSATPVREAMSRLAGEELVDKRGPVYTRPHLDGAALAELHHLRLVYLSAAMAAKVQPRGRRGMPLVLSEVQGDPAGPHAIVGALFREIMLGADDLVLVQAYQRAAARLAPFEAVEVKVLADLDQEALDLVNAYEAGTPSALRARVRHYHRRRIIQSHVLSRLAGGAKYRPDIV
jgi:DNA-binding Lrp family transcriptional regulator